MLRCVEFRALYAVLSFKMPICGWSALVWGKWNSPGTTQNPYLVEDYADKLIFHYLTFRTHAVFVVWL